MVEQSAIEDLQRFFVALSEQTRDQYYSTVIASEATASALRYFELIANTIQRVDVDKSATRSRVDATVTQIIGTNRVERIANEIKMALRQYVEVNGELPRNFFDSMLVDGLTVNEHLDRFSIRVIDDIKRSVRIGWSQGETSEEIARRIHK